MIWDKGCMMHNTGCMLNQKSQILNPKQIQNPNVKCSKQLIGAALAANVSLMVPILNFGHLDLFRISDFVLRISQGGV